MKKRLAFKLIFLAEWLMPDKSPVMKQFFDVARKNYEYQRKGGWL